MTRMSREEAYELYKEHEGKDFFEKLIEFVTRGPVVMMVIEGPRAVEAVRNLVGKTDGVQASAGTIRGDFSLSTRENIVHASDSSESARREIKIFFKEIDL
ncbi:MAG: nucleoside-diphosphate kinase, partial [Thermotoga sp.]